MSTSTSVSTKASAAATGASLAARRSTSGRNTLLRSLHDLGLATWFGGSLMGAVGLNGGTAEARDTTERARLSALGWKRWAPVNAVALGVHGVGGAGLILANRRRLHRQGEAATNTSVKLGLTVAAAGLTVYSGLLGRVVEEESGAGAQGATEPDTASTKRLADAQRKLKAIQWAIPAATGVLIVLAAQQGEQQRPGQQLSTRLGRG